MGAPMPFALRSTVRAHQHDACRVECSHCGAHEWQPCTTPSKRHRLEIPHSSRIEAAARTVAPAGVVSLAEYRETKEAGDAAQAQ